MPLGTLDDIMDTPLSDVQVTGMPAFEQQFNRGIRSRAGHETNQAHQDLLTPGLAGNQVRRDEVEAARFAKISHDTRAARDMAELASPFAAENRHNEHEIGQRMRNVADRAAAPRVKEWEDRLRKTPADRANEFRNSNEAGVVDYVRREHKKQMGQLAGQIESNPLYNRPGMRFSGQKSRAKRQLAERGVHELTGTLAKLRYQAENEAHKLGQNQQTADLNTFAGISAAHDRDVAQQILGTHAINELEQNRLKKIVTHAGVSQGFGAKEEAREQAVIDALIENLLEKRDWESLKTKRAADIAHGLPGSGSISHNIRQNAPSVYGAANEGLANTLFSLGTNMFARQRHAAGDSVAADAVQESMLDNSDPLTTFNKLMRRQLMIGLMQRKQNQRAKFKKGDSVSPIQVGAQMAKGVASNHKHDIQEQLLRQQLAEAERLEHHQEPEEEPLARMIARSISQGLSATPGYSAMGQIGNVNFEQDDTARSEHQKNQEIRRQQAFQLKKDVAKELNDIRRADRQEAMDERRLRNDEMKLNLYRERLAHNPQAEIAPITIGEREIRPKSKIGLRPTDITQLKDIEKKIGLLETKKHPYTSLKKNIETHGEKLGHGLISNFIPDYLRSPEDLEYGTTLNKVITSEMPTGAHTKAKEEFTKASKPTRYWEPEKVKEWADKGEKVLEEDLKPYELARQYAAYDIPPRITLGVYEQWNKQGKPGNFDDYLGNFLEGNAATTSHHEKSNHHEIPMSELSMDELHNIANGH